MRSFLRGHRCVPSIPMSSPAKAGDPVRRGLSIQSQPPLEYWIARSSRAMTAEIILTARFRLSFAISLSLSERKGAGKTGRWPHPQPRGRRKLAPSKFTTGSTGHPGLPRAMVFTVSFVLSPVSGVYCHRCRSRTGGADRRHGRGARTTRLCRTLRTFRPASEPA